MARHAPWLVALGFVTVFAALHALGGAGARLAESGAEVLPFVAIALAARAGAASSAARVLAVAIAVAVTGVVALLLASTAARLDPSAGLAATIGTSLAVLVGWATLRTDVASACARRLPIDPASFVHRVALATVVALTLALPIPLLALGEPPLLAMARAKEAGELAVDPGGALLGLLWVIPAAFVAAGWPQARSPRATLARLGLERPTLPRLRTATLVAIGLVAGMVVVGAILTALLDGLGAPVTEDKAVERLFEGAFSLGGALALAVAAGVGEELAIRGLLQPRLGALLSNLFFTALHAPQYGLDGLLVVFLLGTAFGALRRRTDTTTSIVAHALYDLGVIALVAGAGGASGS